MMVYPQKKVKVHHPKIDMENVPKVGQIIKITKQVKERNLKEVGPIIQQIHLGVSENSVPLNPMVLLIIIPFLNGYFIGNIPYFQTNPLIYY